MSEFLDENPENVDDGVTVVSPDDRLTPKPSGAKEKGAWIMRGVKRKSDKRLLYMMGGAVLIAGGAFFFLGGNHGPKSTLPSAPGNLNSTQGTAVPTESYRRMLQEQDAQRAKEAAKTGGSALPTVVYNGNSSNAALPTAPTTPAPAPVAPPSGPILPNAPAGAVASPKTNPVTPVQASNYVPVAPQRVAAMLKEIQALDQGAAPGPLVVDYPNKKVATNGEQQNNVPYNRAYMGHTNQSQSQMGESAKSDEQSSSGNAAAGPYTVPAPGTKLYSIMGGMDSDAPGPITATILQGPLSGARLLGSAQTTSMGAAVIFNSMTIPYHNSDGVLETQTLPIRAYAISVKNGTTDVATSVNNHILLELAVNFVSSLAGNFGQLLSSSGASTVVSPTGSIGITNPALSTEQELGAAAGTAIGTAGQTFAQTYGNRPTTIKIAKGTPFMLLFVGKGGN